MDVVRLSKRLPYVPRHHPESAGPTLDGAGRADVEDLLAAFRLTRA
jgi:RNA:NAD 2'-phosphotransferase (TPT1/KptA family)